MGQSAIISTLETGTWNLEVVEGAIRGLEGPWHQGGTVTEALRSALDWADRNEDWQVPSRSSVSEYIGRCGSLRRAPCNPSLGAGDLGYFGPLASRARRH
jgi:hypothetical protein